ncbi:glycosyl hydrolase family 18 protein [Photobacterium japonica]|uniref:glycosyl hydrolase family 18 protein n=1 Tax=Photobacterium japonica TaxID=2910235 RepID=UPI003D0DDB61
MNNPLPSLKKTTLAAALPLLLTVGIGASTANAMPPLLHDYFTGQHGNYEQTSGKVVATYIANWGNPDNIDNVNGDNLTHILYAFLDICGPNERPSMAQICADKPDYTLAENATSIDKTFAAKFAELKVKYPHVKVLPSVGGWGGEGPFAPMAMNPENRQFFVNAVVEYVKHNPSFDGIDIDWEWPRDTAEGDAYADLMIDLRAGLDALSKETGRDYLVTSAIATAESYVNKVDYKRAEPAMDLIFLMTYDFYGGWSMDNVGHHTSLQPHEANLANGYGYGGAVAVQNMLNIGMPADKLVLGMAKYARGWDGVTPSNLGTPLGGTATGKFPKPVQPWDEAGVATYSRLVADIIGPDGVGIDGFDVRYDPSCDCHYAWRESDGALVGFDHPKDVENKARFAVSNKLAGVFSWEYGQDNGDLLNAMNYGIGNLDNDLPTGPDAWLASKVYVKGDVVSFNGEIYVAKWWTKDEEPGNPYGAWEKELPWFDNEWSPTQVYQAGDSVLYYGMIYQAKWWTLNNEPGDKFGPWEELAPPPPCGVVAPAERCAPPAM